MSLPEDPSPINAMTVGRRFDEDGQVWLNGHDLATALAMLELDARNELHHLEPLTVGVLRRIVDQLGEP